MKLGIVGSGKIVKYFLTGINQIKNLKVVAICTTPRSRQIGEKLAKKYNISEIYTNDLQICQSTNIDTVYVGVPNSLHYQIAKLALEHNKNVICEKPFFTSVEQAKELKTLADKKHLILLEAVKNVYLPNFIKMQEELKKLGPIHIVCLNYTKYSSRYDNFLLGKIEPVFDPKKDGGALMDLNVYNIHLAVHLFGKPQTVQYFPNRQKGVDTSGILHLGYKDKQVELIAAKDSFSVPRSFIEGEKGFIYFDGSTSKLSGFTIQLKSGEKKHFSLNKYDHQLISEFNKFIKIIDSKDYNKADIQFQYSLAVLNILMQARKQAY